MMAPDVVEEVQQHIYSSDFFFFVSRWRANWKELHSDWNFIFLASSFKNLKNKSLLLYIVDVISCCSPLPSNAFSDIESRIYIFWCATGHYKSRRVFLKNTFEFRWRVCTSCSYGIPYYILPRYVNHLPPSFSVYTFPIGKERKNSWNKNFIRWFLR